MKERPAMSTTPDKVKGISKEDSFRRKVIEPRGGNKKSGASFKGQVVPLSEKCAAE